MSMNSKSNLIIQWMVDRGYYVENDVIMKPNGKPASIHRRKSKKRYNDVRVWYKGKEWKLSHARVMLWLAEGPPEHLDHFVVDHINRNKHDDRVANLRWVSFAQNMRNVSEEVKQQRVLAGHELANQTCMEKHGRPRLTCAEGEEIRRKHALGENTKAGLAREYNVSAATVRRILKDPEWKGRDYYELQESAASKHVQAVDPVRASTTPDPTPTPHFPESSRSGKIDNPTSNQPRRITRRKSGTGNSPRSSANA